MRGEYRRRPGRDTVHFHPDCRWYPGKFVGGIVVTDKRPDDLCNNCRALEKRDKKEGKR